MIMDRSYPVLKDIRAQNPDVQFAFLYEDGGISRTIMCDRVVVGERAISAFIGSDLMCQIDAKTLWRVIHRSLLDVKTGAEVREIELRNTKTEKDIVDRLTKEMKLEEPKIETEYTQSGYNPKLYP